jgi:hypothetical protein
MGQHFFLWSEMNIQPEAKDIKMISFDSQSSLYK